MSDMPKEEPKRSPTYFVHNTSRSRFNRAERAAAPEHGGMKQYIGGEHRLVRGRPIAMTEETLMKHLPELKAKKKFGLIDVKDADGRSIDLETGKKVTLAPPPVPLPNPPLDSIQNDKPAGVHMPQIAGGYAETHAPGTTGPQLPDLVAAAPSEKEEADEAAAAEGDEEVEEPGDPAPAEGTAGQPQQTRSDRKKNKR